jgi:glutamate synthase domain-containing protein 3
MRIRRRHELQNIKLLGDVNELSISGHVEHEPTLREDDDRDHVCEFVLTHTTGLCGRWERQRYNIQAYGQLGEYYAANWQPGQAIVIDGRLEQHVCDTLAGPIPSTCIVAHCIDDTLGPHPHRHTATSTAQ